MTAFHLPQPGERQNAAAVPVQLHTLRALLAAALAWEIDTSARFGEIVPPQISDATDAVTSQLADADVRAAAIVAERMMRDRAEAEGRA